MGQYVLGQTRPLGSQAQSKQRQAGTAEASGTFYKIGTCSPTLGWRARHGGKGTTALNLRTILSCTEEEKAEARAFEEDQVAGRLKEDVVSRGAGCGGVGVVEDWALPRVFIPLFSSLCSSSREAGYRNRWQRR